MRLKGAYSCHFSMYSDVISTSNIFLMQILFAAVIFNQVNAFTLITHCDALDRNTPSNCTLNIFDLGGKNGK
jgi:hypothetical protein